MKLLIITAVKSYEKEAVKLFKKAGIFAFSNAEINGFKALDQEDLIDNWFSSSTRKCKINTFFYFCRRRKIDRLLKEMEAVE